MTDLRVIGIDPGPTPGLVLLDLCNRADERPSRWLDDVEVLQCSAGLVNELLGAVLTAYVAPSLLQIERFVARGRATAEQRLTTDQVAGLTRTADNQPGTSTTVVLRTASQVKPWATDARLEAAGLLDACKGMRHARDAARHALFAAVHDGGLPDPLSKEFTG